MTAPPALSRAEREASRWIARLVDASASDQDRLAFEAWHNASPENARAYAALSSTWARLGELAPGTVPVPPNRPARSSPGRLAPVFAGALAIALLVGSVVTFRGPADAGKVMIARIGEHRNATLPDGTAIALNADTRLVISFSRGERRVRLHRGEAAFDVGASDERPFVIETPQGDFAARQGRFTVCVTDQGARATILEGQASGIPRQAPFGLNNSAEPIIGHADQELRFFNRRVVVTAMDSATIARRTAWRIGMLSFAGEPLREASSAVTRQTGVSFAIDDPAIAGLRVGGYIRADDIGAFRTLLRDSLDIESEVIAPNRVSLHRRVR